MWWNYRAVVCSRYPFSSSFVVDDCQKWPWILLQVRSYVDDERKTLLDKRVLLEPSNLCIYCRCALEDPFKEILSIANEVMIAICYLQHS